MKKSKSFSIMKLFLFFCMTSCGKIEDIPVAWKATQVGSLPSTGRGQLDSLDGTGLAWGWAYDTQDPSQSTMVHFFVDGPYGSSGSQFIGTAFADIPRPDVNGAFSVTGNHGFSFQIPDAFKDSQTHQLYAHIISLNLIPGMENALLGGSGVNFGFLPVASGDPQICQINNLSSLQNCFANYNSYDEFYFTDDVSCEGDDCCTQGGALMKLHQVNNKTISGNNHILKRNSGQRYCPALQLENTFGVKVNNLNFDENNDTPPCGIEDGCYATIDINHGNHTWIENVGVYSGKWYTVYVTGTDGFTFKNSRIASAGVIGLYVGHRYDNPSRRIRIQDSIFAGSRTNGLAIEGIYGAQDYENSVENNVFNRNHWYGLWNICGVNGDEPCGGGQMFIAIARHLRVVNNIIGDGYCVNNSGGIVWGVELGDPPPGAIGPVRDTSFIDNYIYNHVSIAFYKNIGVASGSDLMFIRNQVTDTPVFSSVSGSYQSDNVHNIASPTLNYQGQASYVVYRLGGSTHAEARSLSERPYWVNEAQFFLRASPEVGTDSFPIYRCLVGGDPDHDFPSRSPTCEGQGRPHSILGYSHAPDAWWVAPVYRCRVGSDHFMSWNSNCEGHIYEGWVAYAAYL